MKHTKTGDIKYVSFEEELRSIKTERMTDKEIRRSVKMDKNVTKEVEERRLKWKILQWQHSQPIIKRKTVRLFKNWLKQTRKNRSRNL